jgi:uncharacterized membrane protein
MTIPFPALAIPLFVQLLVALALLALPHIAHHDLLFGVPVPEGFRSTEAGRGALRSYRLWIVIPAALSLLGTVLFPKPLFLLTAVLAIPVVGIAAFVVQNRKLKPFAIQPPLVRETTLSPPEPLPWFAWLGLPPLLSLAGVAMYLHSHWDQIPARFPVHFGLDGAPDGWADRTVRGVYGPLFLGAEITVLLFAFALAGWYGTRRSELMRRPVLVVMLAVEWTIAFAFGAIPLKLAIGIAIPTSVLVLGPFVFLIPGIAYAVRQSIKPHDVLDPTPNECWKGGILYYNPNDAALFVQRRDGVGYTVNLGNRWSWAILGSLLLMLASMAFVLGS